MLDGTTLTQVAEEEGLTVGRISQLLDRCLGGDPDRPAALTDALIPFKSVKPRQRHMPLPCLHSPGGYVGSFSALLALAPQVQKTLDGAIEAYLKRKRQSERLTAAGLHQQFLRRLAELDWPVDRYPYTTQSRGREAVRRYFHRRRAELAQALTQRQISRYEVGIISPLSNRALSYIQIDEHPIDLHNRLAIEFNGELINLRIARCTLLLAIDVATQCILGFLIVPTGAPNQQDVLALLERCLTSQEPPAITTPQFEAPTEPVFPTELRPVPPLSLGVVLLDNAWIHHSNAVIDFLGCTLGATLNYGFPALPLGRALVEHVFDYLERHLGHRFDSTTGSSVVDPIRESERNAKQAPALSFQSLEEATYLMIGEFNLTPRPHMAGAAPFSLFRHHTTNHWLRHLTRASDPAPQPLRYRCTVQVHRPPYGQGHPYVQCMYCRYRGDWLTQLPLDEKKILIEFDRRDIRWLRARRLSGQSLGTLRAPRTWLRFAHSLATRQLLFRNKRTQRSDHQDPLTGWFLDQLEHRDQPQAASQMLRIYLEYTASGKADLQLGQTSDKETIGGVESASHQSNASGERVSDSGFTWSPLAALFPPRGAE
ncbi:hypothetical protein [Marinobacter sp. R17]|uniref:hypothetical protein n=1 Tax=Marinobacter sp. R17 TaxID=2484250 RepID=UPI000F4C30FA|nr:hypothetical protein [Marinobacter sp. R17]